MVSFLRDNASLIIAVINILVTLGFFTKFGNKISGKDRDDAIIKRVGKVEETLTKKINDVSEKCDDNERERLRNVIFSYSRRIPYKEYISGEEIADLKSVYQRYANLNGNGQGHDEYNRIINYYNEKGWEK